MPNPSFFCPLPAYGLLAIESSDNIKFLQGQFTCDVREVSDSQWRYGALCTPKGRVIGNFLLLQAAPNRHLLRLPVSVMAAVAGTLKKFAPFYKGSVSDISPAFRLLGVTGPDAPAALATRFAVLPKDKQGCTLSDGSFLLRLDEQRYECWIQADSPWHPSLPQETPATWDLLTIRCGLGEVRGPTVEEWTPHMLNLQAVGAVNFKKGCYTGQEIVARTEYLGHQKRAMYRIEGSGPTPPEAAPVLDGEQSAGEIVMASPSDSGPGWEALAVIGASHLDKPLTCLGQPVQRLDLPYTVERR